MGPQAHELLAEPSYFLHGLDSASDRALFIPTTSELLREAAFIDGRTAIATGAPIEARLSELIGAEARRASGPDRYIFHMGFCGSTLLARLLDWPGASLALKEPNCLVDLANEKTASARSGKADDDFGRRLAFARAMLRRRWRDDEAIVVKPSSWINNLLDEFCAVPGELLPVFVTIDRNLFVRAVFRGGTDRIAHVAQLAWHLAPFVPGGDQLVGAAIDTAGDSLAKAANLAVLAHHLEMSLVERALDAGGWGRDRVIDFDDIARAPLEAAGRANALLKLGLSSDDLERSLETHGRIHSKAPTFAFHADQRAREDATVEANYGSVMRAAIEWADTNFRDERL